MRQTISKNVFLNAAVCPTLGWRLRSDPTPELTALTAPTLSEKFRMEQGAEIGRRARNLYPEGTLIAGRDLSMTAGETSALVRAGGPPVLFEATFLIDDYAAKADVLQRAGDHWHLVEVKMNVNLKQELIDDLTYTLMVLGRAGLRITKASLMLISKDFRVGMDDSKLFTEYDCTKDAFARLAELQLYWDVLRNLTSAASMPKPAPIPACKGCDLFGDCMGKGIENHIFEIPRLSAKKVDALKDLGISRIEAIPYDFEFTAIQARVKQAVISGEPWIGPNLKQHLNAVRWPAHYLDFETMMMALPLYPEVAPYTQVPTQYSIHTCGAIGDLSHHAEYLSDPSSDSRRELALRLLADLPGDGSIVTYSNFEKTTINGLATLLPDLARQLTGLTSRMFDLEAVIRDNYYHPSFHGKTSVKSTLPALLPDMSYEKLNIKDGDSASTIFAYMAMGRFGSKETESLKRDLLAYCGQDTLAMVKLHERLYAA